MDFDHQAIGRFLDEYTLELGNHRRGIITDRAHKIGKPAEASFCALAVLFFLHFFCTMMDAVDIDRAEILYQFRKNRGLLGIKSKIPVRDEYMLSLLYTPGVAEPCRQIHQDVTRAVDYTTKGNAVALLSDASDVVVKKWGPYGLIPLLESQAVLCRELAAVDVYPFSIDTDTDGTFIEVAVNLHPAIAAIALDYVEFPKVLDYQESIAQQVQIPVVNMGGEMVATLLLAAFHNAARMFRKKPEEVEILLYGIQLPAYSLWQAARCSPFKNITAVDPTGRFLALSPEIRPKLPESISPHIVVISEEEVEGRVLESLHRNNVVFDFAASEHRAETVRHYLHFWKREEPFFHPALIFPGFFRGILDCRLPSVPMHFFARIAEEVAHLQSDEKLREGRLFPNLLDAETAATVARAVAQLAQKAFPDRNIPHPERVYTRTFERIYAGGSVSAGSSHLKKSKRKKSSQALAKESLELHEQFGGAIEIVAKLPLRDEYMLQILSPPHIWAPAQEILKDRLKVYEYTSKSNLVAVITDGSAVLGLGNIGPEAALPVMEGKALLFKTFAGIESIPICLGTQDPDAIIRIVAALTPIMGAINLEDISAPRCFYIEERLRRMSDIPIFHDDQHGTATVVLAGLINAARFINARLSDLSIVINGAGASGIAVTKLLLKVGVEEILLCDTQGALYEGRPYGMNFMKEEIAKVTNRRKKQGTLRDVIKGAKVLVGLSGPGLVDQDMVRSMDPDPLIFALANPTPEIMPEWAEAAGAAVVATGRSDWKNQINNALAFPGILRGALDIRAKTINDEMKIGAAKAIAYLVSDQELHKDYIIPKALDFRVSPQVAAAVAKAALETGQARVLVDPTVVRDNTREFLYGGRLNPVVGEPL